MLDATTPERFTGDRKFYSINYFLLKSGDVLRLHTLHQDEQWFFHKGSSLRLHIFAQDGSYRTVILGQDLDQGQMPRTVVPHDTWFGAELLGPGYALVSCSLAPGYDKRDSNNPTFEQIAGLKRDFPDQAGIVDALTHETSGA